MPGPIRRFSPDPPGPDESCHGPGSHAPAGLPKPGAHGTHERIGSDPKHFRPGRGPVPGAGNFKAGILSGDHREAATRVARAVGIEEVHSGLTPEDKAAAVIRCREEGFPVMFVGDGINDAPALASSHVGVAMGAGGTEAALETADIALIHDDISKLPWLISLSRRMTVVIRINVAFGLAFNTLAVIAGGMGWLSPVEAALVHNIGSILVVMTAASLALYPEPAPESP